MDNTLISKITAVCVVLLMVGLVAIPLVQAANTEESETTTETRTYGNNTLDAYVDTIASSLYGNVSAEYTSYRSDSYGEASPSGDYVTYPSGMLALVTGYAGAEDVIYALSGNDRTAIDIGTLTLPYETTVYGATVNLTINTQNSDIVDVAVTTAAYGTEIVLPYDVTYLVPTQYTYGNNTIHDLVLTDSVGDMTGTTFTPNAGGDWLQIPLHIMQNSTETYKVLQGETIYAPDTNGDLAAFTASTAGTVSGTNSAVTLTLTQDTAITSATVYNLSATITDTDLPGLVIKLKITAEDYNAPTNVAKVISNSSTTYYITSSGALYGVGNNNQGQVGNGTETDVSTPYQIASSGVTDVLQTSSTAFYITSSGALYGMGANNYGQIGTGNTGSVKTSYQIASSGVTDVVAYNDATYYIQNGALYGMGNNTQGKIGNGNSGGNVTTPYQIASSGVTKVVTSNGNATFYIQNGALYGMGQNNNGQVGNGTTTSPVKTPYQIASSGVTDVFAGGSTAYYIQNGALYGMGYNIYGQMGNGTTTSPVTTPYQIASSGVTDVVASGSTTYYITSSGALYGIGMNMNGQIGDGTTNSAKTPYEIASSGVTDVFTNGSTTYYITSSGALYGIGLNNKGQVGNGTTTDVKTPYEIESSGVTRVFQNGSSTLYIQNGTLYGMGQNSYGQIGNGTTTDVTTPYQIASSGVTDASVGTVTTLYIQNGTLYGMGANNYGQMGWGNPYEEQHTPVSIYNDVSKLCYGSNAVFYITSSGALYGMGANGQGQMGNGTTANVTTPYQIASSGVTDVVTTNQATYYIQNGALYGMGQNNSGQVGNGTTTSPVKTPYQIASSGVTDVFAGGSTAYYIQNGALYGMGANNQGQVGNGTTTNVTTPYQIASSGVTKVVTLNGLTTFYITSSGALYGMGSNGQGRIGNGTTTNVTTPYQIESSGVTDVVATNSTFYIKNGALYGMGANGQGQIGNGTTTDVTTPYEIESSGVTDVFAGSSTAYYITSSGALYAIGSNANGQIGNGTTTNVSTPYQIASSGVTDVFTNGNTTYYITSSGALYGVGYNNKGQIGNGGTQTPIKTPYEIESSGVTGVFQYGAGTLYTKNGALYGVGQNDYGQVGNGTTANVTTPYQIASSGVTDVTIGLTNYYIQNGTLYGVGYNNSGQLGLYAPDIRTTPTGAGPLEITDIVTNPTETETVADQRGTVTSNVFTPSVDGDYLYIPILDAETYTYYVSLGSTVYAPNTLGDALAPHVVPDTTGIDPDVTITLTQVGGYNGQVYSVTATSTDSDVVGFAIPYTVTYMQDVETTFAYNAVGDSGTYIFTPTPAGDALAVPYQMTSTVGFSYYIDDEDTFYYSNGGTIVSDTADAEETVTGTVSVAVGGATDGVRTIALVGGVSGFMFVPRAYTDGTNDASSYAITYTPVRGTVSGGSFTEDADGDYMLVYTENLQNTTYYIGDGRTYYVALSGSVSETATAPDATGLSYASLTFTALADPEQVYTVTGSADAGYVVLIPYTVTYDVTETVVTEKFPLLGIIPVIFIIMVVLFAVNMIPNRRSGL